MEEINYDKFSYQTAKGLKVISRRNEIDIKTHLDIIRKLKPLNDSVFRYDKQRWMLLNSELKDSVIGFLDTCISRQHVIDAFEQYFEGNIGIERPFALTMIWGFSDNGYGTFCTNKYFDDLDNRMLIKEAFNFLKIMNLKRLIKPLKK